MYTYTYKLNKSNSTYVYVYVYLQKMQMLNILTHICIHILTCSINQMAYTYMYTYKNHKC